VEILEFWKGGEKSMRRATSAFEERGERTARYRSLSRPFLIFEE
jgi:hypothetical protein